MCLIYKKNFKAYGFETIKVVKQTKAMSKAVFQGNFQVGKQYVAQNERKINQETIFQEEKDMNKTGDEYKKIENANKKSQK